MTMNYEQTIGINAQIVDLKKGIIIIVTSYP